MLPGHVLAVREPREERPDNTGEQRTGLEKPLRHEAAGPDSRRYREEAAPGVDDVLAECVVLAEAALDRDELLVRIALERDEEEPRIQLTGHRIDAVGVGIATPEDALAAVRCRARRDGCARRPGSRGGRPSPCRQVGSVVLMTAGERSAARLEAADRLLLVAERGAVPGLDPHPDPPRDEVAPAPEPGRGSSSPTQTKRLIASASSPWMFLVPSLKPWRFRAVDWLDRVEDVRPKPSCDQRRTAPPRAIRARFRTAWNATVGSSAHACTQRSPPDLAASSSSPGRAPIGVSRAGLRAARPKRSLPPCSKTVSPSPKVTVSFAGGSPTASPVSTGGASSLPPADPTGLPAVIAAAAAVHSRSSSRSSAFVSIVRSNVAKKSRSWAAVAIPAWCSPWNGTDSAVPAGPLRRSEGPGRRPRRGRRHRCRRPSGTRACPGDLGTELRGDRGHRLGEGVHLTRESARRSVELRAP